MKISQTEALYKLLQSGPIRTDQICEKVYGSSHLGLARCGARIYDIKQKYGVEIEGWHDEDKKTLWWYRIKPKTVKVVCINNQYQIAL